MKNVLVRGTLGAVLLVSLAVAFMIALSPVTLADPPASCEQQCYQDYHRCVPICSKNPCFVSCETVLEICLSNCGVGGAES